MFSIGNAPCSWGVEFADDARNPTWKRVLSECSAAGYKGIELGPIGFMPEDPAQLADGLAENNLKLIGGVVFRPFHDPGQTEAVMDAVMRTCVSLRAHGAKHLVLIDSISPQRAPTAGRPAEAYQMDHGEWARFRDSLTTAAKIGTEEFGLTVGIHAHAAGFMDFEPELERLLDEVDENILKVCFDTGHHCYAGYDPVAFMKKHIGRISYIHLKDIDPAVRDRVVSNRIGFYEACADRIFCNLGEGMVNFPAALDVLQEAGFSGWCTVEQDCDPAGDVSPLDDARANRDYLRSIGFGAGE